MTEKINSLKRKVKSCGLNIIPISGVVNKDELNPFENFTRLRTVSNVISKDPAKYPYRNHKDSVDSWYEDEESKLNFDEKMLKKKLNMFIRSFEYFLRNYYGFIIESEN